MTIKWFWAKIKPKDEKRFIDALDKLCKKYAGKEYNFTFSGDD